MIYFLRAGPDGPVKIGQTVNLKSRIASLQTGHHTALITWRVFEGSDQEEAQLHAKFRASHIRGEWFHYNDQMAGDLGLTEIILTTSSTKEADDKKPSCRHVQVHYAGGRIDRFNVGSWVAHSDGTLWLRDAEGYTLAQVAGGQWIWVGLDPLPTADEIEAKEYC